MSSFCKCKSYSHFYSKNISVNAIFNDKSVNNTLTNNIVCFEQLGPGVKLTIVFIEDFTQVVISYEIYEMSLQRVSEISYEMTMSVRFYLSYKKFKLDFIAFKIVNCSTENAWLTWTSS